MLTPILQRSARHYLSRHTPYVIGITGSIGKTTCRTIMTQTLRQLMPDLRVESSKKNFNTESGLPLSILGIHTRPSSKIGKVFIILRAINKALFWSKHYDLLIAEYGIDAPGDMDIHLQTCIPNIGILTGIDLVHAEWLISPDTTVIEKIKLINNCTEVALIHQWTLHTVSKAIDTEVDQLTFALLPDEANEADIWFHHRLIHQQNEVLTTSFNVDQEKDTITKVTTNLLSHADAGYISLAIQVAQILERRISQKLVVEKHTGIDIQLQSGRYSIIPWQYGSILIDSSYNAAPKSMVKVINDTIKLRNQFWQDMDLIYVLGDMRELGEYSEAEHRKLMAQVAQSADRVYLVGPQMTQRWQDELIKLWYNPQHIISQLSSEIIGQHLLDDISNAEKRALVLFKWSQNTIFTEESIKPLLKKNQNAKLLLCRQDKWWMSVKRRFFVDL